MAPPPSIVQPTATRFRTRLLVSVRDAGEAVLAREAGADLVDAKDPSRGALGALGAATVAAIVARAGPSVATSAVAGEPGDDRELVAGVAAIAATGVGFVKVAIDRRHGHDALERAASTAAGRLIAVLFAEDGLDLGLVAGLAASGLRGAMIDTRGKDGRRLRDHVPTPRLAEFVAATRAHGMMSGLAGSLRLEDVPELAALGPDYLGFRGGLCLAGDRRNPLDAGRVALAARALRGIGRRDAA